mgnify:CR=1 FL=1
MNTTPIISPHQGKLNNARLSLLFTIILSIVNIIAMFMLGKVALKVLAHYEKQKKEGKKPVFYEDEVGLTGTVWTRDRK